MKLNLSNDEKANLRKRYKLENDEKPGKHKRQFGEVCKVKDNVDTRLPRTVIVLNVYTDRVCFRAQFDPDHYAELATNDFEKVYGDLPDVAEGKK